MFHIPAHKNLVHPAGQVINTEPLPGAIQQPSSPMPDVDKLIAFEQGDLDDDQVIELFQHGIDNGWVWKLQGFYGRTADSLIKAGYCHRKQ